MTENKETTKATRARKKDRTLKARNVLKVPFFSDEYAALGLSPDSTYYEAVAMIRSKTGCVIGARTRQGGVSKSALYRQFENLTDEQKKAISRIIGESVDE
jgi:hypothetical protein